MYICMNMSRFCNILAVLTATVAMSACSGRSGGAQSGRTAVTVSIPPQEWLVEAIGGDSVEVTTLLPAGSNPETFEPGVSAMNRAATGDLLLLSGALGFERTLADKLSANNGSLRIVDTSRGIEPLYGTHDNCEHHSHLESDDHAHQADPHTWTSIKNARIMASNILEALSEATPSRRDYYTRSWEKLDSHLDSMDRAVAGRLAPLAGRSFLVWHPSLGYFARDYGLQQVSIGQEGRESSVKSLRERIDRAVADSARVLFLQADFDSRQAANVARETGSRVVTINPLSPDWEEEINTITDALTHP